MNNYRLTNIYAKVRKLDEWLRKSFTILYLASLEKARTEKKESYSFRN